MDERLNDIKTFWEGKAKEHGTSHESSWGDYYAMELEVRTIAAYLKGGERILDIGCGNGLSTLALAVLKNMTIKGIDYAEGLIKSAHILLDERKGSLKGDVSFSVGDVMNLDEPESTYDIALTRRVIINLGSFENQVEAARNVHRSLAPGGTFLMSEATAGGLKRLNSLRREFGIEDLSAPWHNLYIDEGRFIEAVSDFFELETLEEFSSTYYVGSRVIQPFVKNITDNKLDYLSEINRFFMMLPSFGDYGIQKLFVFRKK